MRLRPRSPLIVLMEDPIIHTVEQPVCSDPTCICAEEEYAQLRAETARPARTRRTRRSSWVASVPPAPGSSSSSRPFRLLR
jgi:hypothetical protein